MRNRNTLLRAEQSRAEQDRSAFLDVNRIRWYQARAVAGFSVNGRRLFVSEPETGTREGREMMKRNGKGLLRLALAVVLVLTVLTAVPISAMADSAGTGITLGTGKITVGNKVWFGNNNGSPVLWRVDRKSVV